MTLSDQQIERYSRQILVTGGLAQERLLAAHVAIIGTANEVEPVARYLAGAGVGHIRLYLIDASKNGNNQLIARVRALNTSVVIVDDESNTTPDLFLVIASNTEVLATLKERCGKMLNMAVVGARLDPPARIFTFPSTGGSSSTLEDKLFAPWPSLAGESPADHVGFVTMVAVTEALKLLMQLGDGSGEAIINFVGYQACRVTQKG